MHTPRTAHTRRFGLMLWLAVALTAAAPLLPGQTPAVHSIVSAASFQPLVAPGGLTSVFGANLAGATVAGVPDEGEYPRRLGGVIVRVDGKAAQLLFVSPSQINLLVPAGTPLGAASVVVERPGLPHAGKAVQVRRAAPGLFWIGGLRLDRGAVLNAVTFDLDPFTAATSGNFSDDKRTRLSLYGTGFRSPAGLEQTVAATDALGRTRNLTVEYLGPAPNYPGLDQVNVILDSAWAGLGLVTLQLRVGDEISNSITVHIGPQDLLDNKPLGPYRIETVAGTGQAGFEGDGESALASRLQSPVAVAIDRLHNLYVADADNHVVRRISPAGVISTFAGSGEAGSGGDGEQAAAAQLRRPAGLAFDALDRLYIADSEDHRVRRVDQHGVMTTVAGTGVSGFSGDQGPAFLAQLDGPSSVAITPAGGLLIADTGNRRIRKVTGDGLIATIAGNGEAGSANEGALAARAPLGQPSSLVVDERGTIFFADGGNYRVRRLGADKRLWTAVGTGENGNSGDGGPSSLARIGPTVNLALDRFGHLFLSDAANHVVRRADLDETIHRIAGTEAAGFAGDGGPGPQARLAEPLGIAVDAVQNVFIPVASSHRVRVLHPELREDGVSCGRLNAIVLGRAAVVGGQPAFATARLNCAVNVETPLNLDSSDSFVQPPASVTIPGGETAVGIEILTLPVDETASATLTVSGGGSTTTSVVTLVPPDLDKPPLSFELDTESVVGGQPIEVVVHLGSPAPPQGTAVSLAVDGAAATVASSVTVPEGQTSLEFLILTSTSDVTPVVLSGATDSAEATVSFDILPGSDSTTARVAGLTLSPDELVGGEPSTATVMLSSAAPEGGIAVELLTTDAAVSVPDAVLIPAGEASQTFTVTTTAVEAVTTATIAARSVNTVQAELLIEPAGSAAAKETVILEVTFSPTAVVGGEASTAAVTLEEPAPPGGALVNLSSSHEAATVPATLVIPKGESAGTVAVVTSVVDTPVTATITAQSANTVSKTLVIEPVGGADPQEGTIASVTLAPSTLTGGELCTATINLNEPAGAGGVLIELDTDSDALSAPPSLIVPAGLTQWTFSVATAAVSAVTVVAITVISANSRTAHLTIESGSGGSQGGTIAGVSFSLASVVGGSSPTGTVTLASAAPAGGVTVQLSSSHGSVAVPANVTVPAGALERTFSINTGAVAASLLVTITATSANSIGAGLTINPPCILSLDLGVAAILGGNNVEAIMRLTGPAPAGGLPVALGSSNPAVSLPASVLVAAGQTSASVNLVTTAVSAALSATIQASVAACVAVDASLTVNAPCVASVDLDVSTILGGSPVSATVQLTGQAPAGGLLVALASSNPAVSLPASVLVAAGQTSAGVSVTTTAVGAALSATIEASVGACAAVDASLTVNAPCVASIDLAVSSILGGDIVNGTVNLTGIAPAGGAVVNLSGSHPILSLPATVTVAAGQLSADFDISVAAVAALLNTTVSASFGGCAAKLAPLAVNPPVLDSLMILPSQIQLLQTATGTCTLSGPAPAGGLVVNLTGSTHNIVQGLLEGVLGIVVPATVTVLAGETSSDFMVESSLVGDVVGLLTNVPGSVEATLGAVTKQANITIQPVP